MEISTSKTVPSDVEEDVEETLPENKLTFDNLAEEFWLFKTVFDFFHDTDPSGIPALKLKQIVGEGLVPYQNTFREMKKQKTDHDVFP